jgi:hypothetical protein
VIFILQGDSSKTGTNRDDKNFCALKSRKRCAIYEICDENSDLKVKLMKSIELFEGETIDYYYSMVLSVFKLFSEAKKETFAVVKAECLRLKDNLDKIIEKQKVKLETIANRNSDKISTYVKEFEKYA